MARILLLFVCLFAHAAHAQVVQPITSPDYEALVAGDSIRPANKTLAQPKYALVGAFPSTQIRKIRRQGHGFQFLPVKNRSLFFSGSFRSSIEIARMTREPGIQTTFAQGRSATNGLAWMGPETDEVFSYGPRMADLAYDGQPYAYDQKGRLVPISTDNARPSLPYNERLFRTGIGADQSFTVNTRLLEGGRKLAGSRFSLRRQDERAPLPASRKEASSVHLMVNTESIRQHLITAQASLQDRVQRQSNRNGLWNRAYERLLRTPPSFSNRQGIRLAGGQRSFSRLADNPFFLLETSGQTWKERTQLYSLGVERKQGPLKYHLNSNWERDEHQESLDFAPGTRYYEGGWSGSMHGRYRQWSLMGKASYQSNLGFWGECPTEFQLNSTITKQEAERSYMPGDRYRYTRSSQDLAIGMDTRHSERYTNYYLRWFNKFYFSNTSNRTRWLLPEVAANVRANLGSSGFYVEGTMGLTYTAHEPSLRHSYAAFGTTAHSLANAFRFLPRQELAHVQDLETILQREWTNRLSFGFGYHISLFAELSKRRMSRDVVPVWAGNQIVLRNAVDHQSRNLELGAEYRHQQKATWHNHTLGFLFTRSEVVRAADGLAPLAIAGFREVYNAVIPGQPYGVVVGTGVRRNEKGERLIGSDGFPLADGQPRVIANPQPRFVAKMTNTFGHKAFSASIDWEWQHGGEQWNGTRAALDYYGRSERSAAQRGITGYVFEGVMADGSKNTQPVSFYDPVKPVEQNRWVRYGLTGMAEDYVERADFLRLNNMTMAYRLPVRKYLRECSIAIYVRNLLIWTPYTGVDPEQKLFDQSSASGIDYFNLPAQKVFGLSFTIQF